MSDLAATNCGGCNGCGDCGCGNNIIWLIILLLLFDGMATAVVMAVATITASGSSAFYAYVAAMAVMH